jgi:transcription elongation factor Elf1
VSNDNCLAGITCPVCAHDTAFLITTTAVLRVTDEGADWPPQSVDTEWDDTAAISCSACAATGTIGQFRLQDLSRTPAFTGIPGFEHDRFGNPTCGHDFMAGTICTLPREHTGAHQAHCQNCGGDWYDGCRCPA